mmetsp:Transcript_45454/g.146333  ORF Transcript_45454/g.146333 Transcript_45454/m.146333 type:complete len:229 (-) Transcript_45454:257-943(-)
MPFRRAHAICRNDAAPVLSRLTLTYCRTATLSRQCQQKLVHSLLRVLERSSSSGHESRNRLAARSSPGWARRSTAGSIGGCAPSAGASGSVRRSSTTGTPVSSSRSDRTASAAEEAAAAAASPPASKRERSTLKVGAAAALFACSAASSSDGGATASPHVARKTHRTPGAARRQCGARCAWTCQKQREGSLPGSRNPSSTPPQSSAGRTATRPASSASPPSAACSALS